MTIALTVAVAVLASGITLGAGHVWPWAERWILGGVSALPVVLILAAIGVLVILDFAIQEDATVVVRNETDWPINATSSGTGRGYEIAAHDQLTIRSYADPPFGAIIARLALTGGPNGDDIWIVDGLDGGDVGTVTVTWPHSQSSDGADR